MPIPGDHHKRGHKKIGIVGSRRRNSAKDAILCTEAFERLYHPGDAIVSGGCPLGADRFAEVIAREYHVPILILYPRFHFDGEHPAGPYYERNGWIAEECDELIALVASDRKGGTEDTVKKALRLGRRVWLVMGWESSIFNEVPVKPNKPA